MAHTLTTELSLVKPTSGTHEPYSITNENANWDRLDGLFNFATGHTHAAAHQGALLSSAALAAGLVLTSPHFTTATVDSGGLQVAAGNIGVGGAVNASYGLLVVGSATSGASQYGLGGQQTGSSAATTEITGVVSQPATAAAGFTCTTVTDFHAFNPVKGAGSTITTCCGLLIDSMTSGNTDNVGLRINAPSGGSGKVLAAEIYGTIRYNNAPTFVSGCRYVCQDQNNGNLVISAIGPAS